jgi:hypothetical protein
MDAKDLKLMRKIARERDLELRNDYGIRRSDSYSELPKHNIRKNRKSWKAQLKKIL